MSEDDFTKTLTREDIERGWILFGDRKIVVLHANVGDTIRLRFVPGEVGNENSNN